MGVEEAYIMAVRLSHLPSVPRHPTGQMSGFHVKYSFTLNEEDPGSSTLPEKKWEKFRGFLVLVALGASPIPGDIPAPGCGYLAVCSMDTEYQMSCLRTKMPCRGSRVRLQKQA